MQRRAGLAVQRRGLLHHVAEACGPATAAIVVVCEGSAAATATAVAVVVVCEGSAAATVTAVAAVVVCEGPATTATCTHPR